MVDFDDWDDESCADARLDAGTLARFVGGLTWFMIHDQLSFGRRRSWWRAAVIEAETRGLLKWCGVSRTWSLTAEGKRHVRGVS